MDLQHFSVKTLLQAAIKSEIESEKVYTRLSERVKNAMLKDRLAFLASEERKHKSMLGSIFAARFPGKEINLPESSEVPLPRITISGELQPLSEIFRMAMEAEMAAYNFYTRLSERFTEIPLRDVLLYTADMEMGHYRILELEKKNLDRFEEIDQYIPFIHLGP